MGPQAHYISGLSLGIGFAVFSSGLPAAAIVFGSALGARAPDWLEIARFNKWTNKRWSLIPHRTITHWPWLWFFIALFIPLTNEYFSNIIGLGLSFFVFGGLLHIGLDYLTPMGVPVGVNPFGKRRSANYIKSGSSDELLVIIASILFPCAAFLFSHL